jgi:4-hydroxybenzoate polyprenyltransferase
MYRWIVFIHIASVLGLLLVHPVTVAFHLKEERDDTRIRELLEVSEAASTLRWIFFGLTLVSGVVLGFLGSWWSTAWIWAALAIFVLIGVVMNVYGGRMIDRIADTRDNAEMERSLRAFARGYSR